MYKNLLVLLFASNACFAQGKPLVLDTVLSNYQYPYPVQTISIQSQQQVLNMVYMDVKPTGWNGKTVMLFHGKNFNGAYWETTIAALNKEGYRVLVPDQIGFGKSSKPLHYQYSFHNWQ